MFASTLHDLAPDFERLSLMCSVESEQRSTFTSGPTTMVEVKN